MHRRDDVLLLVVGAESGRCNRYGNLRLAARCGRLRGKCVGTKCLLRDDAERTVFMVADDFVRIDHVAVDRAESRKSKQKIAK